MTTIAEKVDFVIGVDTHKLTHTIALVRTVNGAHETPAPLPPHRPVMKKHLP